MFMWLVKNALGEKQWMPAWQTDWSISGKDGINVASRQIYPRHVTVLKAGISVTARHGKII